MGVGMSGARRLYVVVVTPTLTVPACTAVSRSNRGLGMQSLFTWHNDEGQCQSVRREWVRYYVIATYIEVSRVKAALYFPEP